MLFRWQCGKPTQHNWGAHLSILLMETWSSPPKCHMVKSWSHCFHTKCHKRTVIVAPEIARSCYLLIDEATCSTSEWYTALVLFLSTRLLMGMVSWIFQFCIKSTIILNVDFIRSWLQQIDKRNTINLYQVSLTAHLAHYCLLSWLWTETQETINHPYCLVYILGWT